MPSVDLDAPEHAVCSHVIRGESEAKHYERGRANRAEAEVARLRDYLLKIQITTAGARAPIADAAYQLTKAALGNAS